MAIEASKTLNGLLFVLIGEKLMQANEDLARSSHAPYRQLAQDLRDLSDVIDDSVVNASKALPPQVGNDYRRAMHMFVDEGGTGYLRKFARQVDDIADGRLKTSWNITEAKWQIIAELIRLLAELAVIMAMSVFSAGASAGRIAVAKARSRVVVLTVLETLLKRTHLLPVASEAFEEAFEAFAVRLAMIAFTSGEFSPSTFDWGALAQEAAFGGLAAGLFGILGGGGGALINALKQDMKHSPALKNVVGDVTSKVGNTTPPLPSTTSLSPQATVRAAPHEVNSFIAGGGSEALAEVLGGGLFTGNWTTTWDTFVGAGISDKVGTSLHHGAENAGEWINGFTFTAPPPTVGPQEAGPDTSGAGGDADETRVPVTAVSSGHGADEGGDADGAEAATGVDAGTDGDGTGPASRTHTTTVGTTPSGGLPSSDGDTADAASGEHDPAGTSVQPHTVSTGGDVPGTGAGRTRTATGDGEDADRGGLGESTGSPGSPGSTGSPEDTGVTQTPFIPATAGPARPGTTVATPSHPGTSAPDGPGPVPRSTRTTSDGPAAEENRPGTGETVPDGQPAVPIHTVDGVSAAPSRDAVASPAPTARTATPAAVSGPNGKQPPASPGRVSTVSESAGTSGTSDDEQTEQTEVPQPGALGTSSGPPAGEGRVDTVAGTAGGAAPGAPGSEETSLRPGAGQDGTDGGARGPQQLLAAPSEQGSAPVTTVAPDVSFARKVGEPHRERTPEAGDGSGDSREAPDAAPAVDYRMVHESDRDYVVEGGDGERLWRFSNHPPEEVFQRGFQADVRDATTPLMWWGHNDNGGAPFVATTRDPGLWYKNSRYRYEVDLSRNSEPNRTGIDLNATIGLEMERGVVPRTWRNYYPREREIVVTGSVDPPAVVSVYDKEENRTGTWNPGANEIDWVPGGLLPQSEEAHQAAMSADAAGYFFAVPHLQQLPETDALAEAMRRADDPWIADYFRRHRYRLTAGEEPDGGRAALDAAPAVDYDGARPEERDAGRTGRRSAGDEEQAATELPPPHRPEEGTVSLTPSVVRPAARSAGDGATGEAAARGELLGSGEVRTDRWIPFGSAPGTGRPDGGRPRGPEAFEFTAGGDGRAPAVRRPHGPSGERTEVGYAWTWHRGETPALDTVRLTRRVHIDARNTDETQAAALQGSLRRALDRVVNERGYRLPPFQPDQVTGPRQPGPLLQVDVEFVGSADQADTVVQVRGGLPGPGRPMVQNVWYTGVHPAAYVHEILHGLGVRDDAADPRVLLTPGGRAEQVVAEGDSSLMGPFEGAGEPRFVLTPDHLRQIADVLSPYLHHDAPPAVDPGAAHPAGEPEPARRLPEGSRRTGEETGPGESADTDSREREGDAGEPDQAPAVVYRAAEDDQEDAAEPAAAETGSTTRLARERAVFEQRLGAHYHADPAALKAARSAVVRLRTVLRAAYPRHSQEVIDASFFTTDPTSAGQVGSLGASSDTGWLDRLLATGSVRELMTAFFNAVGKKALYEGDAEVPSLSGVVTPVLRPGDDAGVSAPGMEFAQELGLDRSALETYAAFLNGDARRELQETVASDPATRDGAYLFDRSDPFALGSLAAHSTRGVAKDPLEIVRSQLSRTARPADRHAIGSAKKSPRDYAYLGAPLTGRERIFLGYHERPLSLTGFETEEIPLGTLEFDPVTGKPDVTGILARPGVVAVEVQRPSLPEDAASEQESGAPAPALRPVERAFAVKRVPVVAENLRAGDLTPDGGQGPEFPLGWVEGIAYWDLRKDSPWYQHWHVGKGMPLVAGVSGTTLRMLRAFEWLNVPETSATDFRKALMGWMLPGQDHSLFEIIRAAHLADVTSPEEAEALQGDVTDLYGIPGLVPAHLAPPGTEPLTAPRQAEEGGGDRSGTSGAAPRTPPSSAAGPGVADGAVSPGTVDEAPAGDAAAPDVAPAVRYELVHGQERDFVVESGGGETLWRFSDRDPEEIFRGGFHADSLDNVVSLREWVQDNPDAPFVATTRDHDLWFANVDGRRKRYRYRIDSVLNPDPTGVDVTATIAVEREHRVPFVEGWEHPYPDEEEVAFTGSVHPRAVVSVYDRIGRRTGVWNPDTEEVEWRAGVHDVPAAGGAGQGGAAGGGSSSESESGSESDPEPEMWEPELGGSDSDDSDGGLYGPMASMGLHTAPAPAAPSLTSSGGVPRGTDGPSAGAPAAADVAPAVDHRTADQDDHRQASVGDIGEEETRPDEAGAGPDSTGPVPVHAEGPGTRDQDGPDAREASPDPSPPSWTERFAETLRGIWASVRGLGTAALDWFGRFLGAVADWLHRRIPNRDSVSGPTEMPPPESDVEWEPDILLERSSAGSAEPGRPADADAVEIARGEVEPLEKELGEAWADFRERYYDARLIRRFETRRYLLPNGEFETRAVVRIWLDPVTPPSPGTGPAEDAAVTEEALGRLAQRARDGVDERYNGGSRLPNGDLFRVEVEFVGDRRDAHHVVHVHAASRREDHLNWATGTEGHVIAHEVGHLLGLDDEYREGSQYGLRPVYTDGALMGGLHVDNRGRPILDTDHMSYSAGPSRRWLPPRHLRELGSAIEAALGTARLRADEDVVFSSDVRSRADGLPTRAHFTLETRRAALYGDPRTGEGGHLPPSGMSARPRPVALGPAGPNGTFRAEYATARGRSAERSHPVAGDLHARQRGQMMFPAHWTEDDAVYAAEQAYLHALRAGRVLPAMGRAGTHTWVGEYAGVRIEGELRHGSFTGFRPSADQTAQADRRPGRTEGEPTGLAAPSYAPLPQPTVPRPGPAFGRRVEDLARYGDRRTRTGAYHAPKKTPAERMKFYGLMIEPGAQHDNGTYEATVWFLDPALRPGLTTGAASRLRPHQDGDLHVMFPDRWQIQELLEAVEQAHAAGAAAGALRQLDDRGTHHWVGEAKGVRIEGLVRDGQHVAYRPTQMQPHPRWPRHEPVGEAAAAPASVTRDGRTLPLEVRQVLFANGQPGFDLTIRIHLAGTADTDGPLLDMVWDFFRQKVADAYGTLPSVAGAGGAPLVRVSLARAGTAEAAHHSFPAGPEELSGLPDSVLDVLPGADELEDLVRELRAAAAPAADAWRPPGDADPEEGQADIRHALGLLDLADPLSRPTTLREPDPAYAGEPFEDDKESIEDSGELSEAGVAGLDGLLGAAGHDTGGLSDVSDLSDLSDLSGGSDLEIGGEAAVRTSQESTPPPAVKHVPPSAPAATDAPVPAKPLPGEDGAQPAGTTVFSAPAGGPEAVFPGEADLAVPPDDAGTPDPVPGPGGGDRTAPVPQGAPVASGQVGTDRWIPFRDSFEITLEEGGRPRIRRRPGSGERTQVGYGWELLRDDRARETVRMTRRVHLVTGDTDPAQVAALRSGLTAELDRLVNGRGHRLPLGSAPKGPGPRLEVAVEFVDTPEQAHSVVRLRSGLPDGRTMRQDTWYTGVHPAAYVHEIVHGLGVIDDDADPRALLTPGGRGEQVLTDDESSLMGVFTAPHEQRFVLTSDHLRQIADVLAPYIHHGQVTTDGPTALHASASDRAVAVNYRQVHPADHAVLVLSGADETLWRFTDDPPETVFARGFRARNTQVVVTLRNWAQALGDGPYVSTTRSPRLWFLQSRYRYQIDASRNGDPTGVDVNATFEEMAVPSPFSTEQEVAFTGSVDPAAVVTVYDSRERRTGTWNPLTEEVEWQPGQLDVDDPEAAGHDFGAAEQGWLAGAGGGLFQAQDAAPPQLPFGPEPAPAPQDWAAAGWAPPSPPPGGEAEDLAFDLGGFLSFLDAGDGAGAEGGAPGSDVTPAVDHRTTATAPPAPRPGTDPGAVDGAGVGPAVLHPGPGPEPQGMPSPVAASVFDGAVEVARGEVVPPGENLRRWGGTGTLVQAGARGYEARRFVLADGRTATRLRVRVRLEPTGPMDPERLDRVAALAREGVETHYNQGSRLPNGDLLRVDLEFVSDPEARAHVVQVHESLGRADFRNWSTALDATVLAHEVGHLLGLRDEYREGAAPGARPVHHDGALMDGPAHVDSRGRPDVDTDHPGLDPTRTKGRAWIPPRHLRQLGSAVDAALGGRPGGTRFDGQDTFTGRDTLAPRSDGLPARAVFPLDVRRSVLYGNGDPAEGGLLPPSGLSSRRRPVRVAWSERRNGTFRAVYPGVPGPGALSETVSHPPAGDLAVGSRPVPGTRDVVMFPSYWTEDDAVYAAEQAYLDALRTGTVTPVDGREGVFAWVGEYGGVRIEGTLAHGEFTGFRPSGDQPDVSPPGYVPAPAVVPATRPGFGSRVEEVARFGDRGTRTGVHHAPGQGHEAKHGLRIEPGEAFDNGTYRATVWFLDPTVAVSDTRSAVPSRWRLHRDGTDHVMFPAFWSPHRVLSAVEEAHAAAVAAGTVRRLPDGRTDHWVGEAAGVRIEGLVRDGQHVAYRPTPVQPHIRWPALRPVGETAPVPAVLTRDGRAYGFDIRHFLFPDGHRGLELTARVHLDAPPGDVMADKVWAYLQRMVFQTYGGANQVHGAPLVRLVRVGRNQAPHHVVPVDPDVLDGVRDGSLLGVPPVPAELVRAGEELTGTRPGPTAWLPPRGTQDGPAARTAIEHALTLPPRSDGPWPLEEPVGEATAGPGHLTRGDRTFGFDVRHVLFADGRRGLVLAVRIHLAPSPDGPDRTADVRRAVRAEMIRRYSAVTRADGAPLVRISPVFVDGPEAAHHTIRLETDPATDRDRILARLPEILGVRPTGADLAGAARDLGGDGPAPDDWAPLTGADGTEGRTAFHRALALSDPLGTPTTLREPDPAHTGDQEHVVTLMQDEVDAAVARVLAPQAPRTDHPEGAFPGGWTRRDLRYAAYVALRTSAVPLAPTGTTTVHGTFGTLDLYLTVEDGLVVDIRPSPTVPAALPATDPGADDGGPATEEPGPHEPETGETESEAAQPGFTERELEELLGSRELLSTLVRQDHVAGLGWSSGAAATWMLEDIALPLGDLRLGREDLVTLLSGHPELFPEAVRTGFQRLTGASAQPD
ncbi:EndoU domain-containing protein [Streptomyces sp. NPDC047000]|uniref:scabin-related ADP-ribosyltransferase n=1 Tax=Streptomyces sp. NPDC047000 TaxID=3155474 RepID=UPI0033E204F7